MKQLILMMVVALATLSSRAQEPRFTTARLINAGFLDIEDANRKYRFFLCEADKNAEKWYTKDRVKLYKKLDEASKKYNSQYKKYAQKAEGTEDEQAWKRLHKLTDKYDKKKNRIHNCIYKGNSMYVQYTMLYLVDPTFEPPKALLYRADEESVDNGDSGIKWVSRNSELVVMKSNINFYYDPKTKPEVTSIHMKVDDTLMDSIKSLVSFVHYTSLNMDESLHLIDGTRAFLFCRSKRMRLTQDFDEHQLELGKTFGKIMMYVEERDEVGLESLRPTINDLIAYYRTLILPDQYLSDSHR